MRINDFKLERFFAEHEFTASYLLCASDCETVTLGELLALEPGAPDSLRSLRLGYTEANGAPALRGVVAQLYESISPDDVLLHAGSSEAIFCFMNCILSPGDHIIVQTPCYQSHYEVARAIGCDITTWVGDERTGWALDPEFLEKAVRPNTKAVMLTVPHNPTGYLMSPSIQQVIVDVARRRGLWLFSDEVFRFLESAPVTRLPAAADLYERAISVGGLSKAFGLPGVRVGWVATQERKLLKQMASYKDYLSLSNGATDEYLAQIALKHGKQLLGRSNDTIRTNVDAFDALVSRYLSLFSWHPPQAGPIALVRYSGTEGATSFCDRILRSSGVLLLPSAQLEFGDAHFRVGLGRANGRECIARFAAALSVTQNMTEAVLEASTDP